MARSATTPTASTQAFRHVAPASRTFCGHDALDALAGELDRLGCRRAVAICNPSIVREATTLKRLAASLGDRLVGSFGDVVEHSPVPVVLAAVDVLRDLDADGVIAVGGGSSIVTARAATILLAEEGDVHELCTQRAADGRLVSPRLLAPKLPIWLLPSTPTTAYGKAGSAVRDVPAGDRLALFDPKTRAQGVVFDAQVAQTAPVGLVRSSALNAFAMTVESILGSRDPLADALLLHGMRTLADALEQLVAGPDDPGVRLELMVGALLAGQGSDYAGGGLAQAIAHAAGPRSSVANGIVEVMLLPHTMRFTADGAPGRLRLVARALDPVGAESAVSEDEHAIAEVRRLLQRLDVPTGLRDVGLNRDALPAIAEHVMDDWSLTRIPRRADRADVLALLEAAW